MNPHDDQYYSPGFDAGASFQMNPLSSHPPRTPKSSVVSRPTTLYNPGYEPSEEQVEEHITAEDLELDEEDERVKQAEKRVLQEEVWKEIILTANGRDKVFVRIRPMENVTVRSPLSVSTESHTIFNSPLSPVPLLCFWDSIDKGAEEEQLELQPCRTAHLHSRWSLADSVCIMQSSLCLNSPHSAPDTHLCANRRLLLLFNWLHPLTLIRAQQASSLSPGDSQSSKNQKSKSFIQTALYSPPPVLLELVAAGADDLGTLARLGLLGKKTGSRADKFADWCFFFSTLVCLVENGVERQMITNLQTEGEPPLLLKRFCID